MIALYIPMQPSSKTPMIERRSRRSAAMLPARTLALAGTEEGSNGRTCGVGWRTDPVSSHVPSRLRKASSSNVSLQRVECRTPALAREALRLRSPTSPGQVPDQLATVRIGPRWPLSPARMWCEYCQTASATMSGASGSIPAKTAIPSFWELMKPCRALGL